ncbi:hypothetical protein IAU60_004816 [Kwoniella sp. DSM 27419]
MVSTSSIGAAGSSRSAQVDQLTIQEKLLLAQAVYKLGAISWPEVSKALVQHPCCRGRPAEMFSPEACESNYVELMKGIEVNVPAEGAMKPLAKVHLRLAQTLYLARMTELQTTIVNYEARFVQLMSEVSALRRGEMDDSIRSELRATLARKYGKKVLDTWVPEPEAVKKAVEAGPAEDEPVPPSIPTVTEESTPAETGAAEQPGLEVPAAEDIEMSDADAVAEPAKEETAVEAEGEKSPAMEKPDLSPEGIVPEAQTDRDDEAVAEIMQAAEAEPEIALEPPAEAELAPEPEAKPEAQPEVIEGAASDPQVHTEAEGRPGPEAEPEVQSDTEMEAEPAAEPEPEPEAEPVAAPEEQVPAESDPLLRPGAVPESEAETEPVPVPESQPALETEPESALESETEPVPEADAEVEPEPEAETEPEPETTPEPEPEPEVKPKSVKSTTSRSTRTPRRAEIKPEPEVTATPLPDARPRRKASAAVQTSEPETTPAAAPPSAPAPKTPRKPSPVPSNRSELSPAPGSDLSPVPSDTEDQEEQHAPKTPVRDEVEHESEANDEDEVETEAETTPVKTRSAKRKASAPPRGAPTSKRMGRRGAAVAPSPVPTQGSEAQSEVENAEEEVPATTRGRRASKRSSVGGPGSKPTPMTSTKRAQQSPAASARTKDSSPTVSRRAPSVSSATSATPGGVEDRGEKERRSSRRGNAGAKGRGMRDDVVSKSVREKSATVESVKGEPEGDADGDDEEEQKPVRSSTRRKTLNTDKENEKGREKEKEKEVATPAPAEKRGTRASARTVRDSVENDQAAPGGTTSADISTEMDQSIGTPQSTNLTPVATTSKRSAVTRSSQKLLYSLLDIVSSHRNGNVFQNPVKKNDAPDYRDVIKRPMDLKTIRSRIKDGQIASIDEFERDALLIFANAMMYNGPDSQVYAMAKEMLKDTEDHITHFRNVQHHVNR